MAIALKGLATSARAQGDVTRAAVHFQQALIHYAELRDPRGMAACVEALARVAGLAGLPEQAARLFGAAEGLRQSAGAALPPREQEPHARSVAATRATLDDSVFAAAWATGRALPLDKVIAEALAIEAPTEPLEATTRDELGLRGRSTPSSEASGRHAP